jgi:hypothetical protein
VAISLARTAFSAISLWMVFLIFRRIKTVLIADTDKDGAG